MKGKKSHGETESRRLPPSSGSVFSTDMAPSPYAHPTRGDGSLDRWLSQQRARIANTLIPPQLRNGRVLDIGCGATPLFLSTTRFREKYGVDQLVSDRGSSATADGITLRHYNAQTNPRLPFPDVFFDVITMLAVLEHIDPIVVPTMLIEIRRVLKPSGLYIITTPAAWTDPLLRIMTRIKLVSPIEIHEHKGRYTHTIIRALLANAEFSPQATQCGYFEFGMNLWAVARK